MIRLKENLKRMRLEARLTQDELADSCGLTSGAISHFETGEREPTLNNLEKLKKGLNCTYDELLTYKLEGVFVIF